MAIRKIVKLGDPVLRKKAKNIEKFDNSVKQLVRDLFHTMYSASGVGLAANQIGVALQAVVVDVRIDEKNNPMVFINPVIEARYGKACEEEGCLSLPGVVAEVKRSAKVVVRALNEQGREFTVAAEGLAARAIEHEIDHLNGVVFIDRISPLKKMKARFLIRRLKREGKWV